MKEDIVRYVIRFPRFKDFVMRRNGREVVLNGNFSLPRPKKFGTEEEADAFVGGVLWAVEYFGGRADPSRSEVEFE